MGVNYDGYIGQSCRSSEFKTLRNTQLLILVLNSQVYMMPMVGVAMRALGGWVLAFLWLLVLLYFVPSMHDTDNVSINATKTTDNE